MLKKVTLLVSFILLWTTNAFSYEKFNVPGEFSESFVIS